MTKFTKRTVLPLAISLVLVLGVAGLVTWLVVDSQNDDDDDVPIEGGTEPRANNPFLEEYVKIPDEEYGYKLLTDYTYRGRDEDFTAFVLNMTSHKWLSEDRVDRTIWWHFLTVVVPDKIVYPDVACLWITGGSNSNDPVDPSLDAEMQIIRYLAVKIGIVCAMQRQNPNGRFRFYADPEQRSRSGDDLIAYSMKYFFVDHRDEPDAVVLAPMTKSVVRAMDTVTKFADSRINRFLVTGASKRGWAAWLAAAVDDRVVAVAPMVLDFLDMIPNFAHHYRSMNGWSWALKDYWYHNVTTYLFDPEAYLVTDIVDPFAYRELLTMPKYIITASMDEFFLPDDNNYFYSKMLGPTYLRVHQNTDHPLIGRYNEIGPELVGFFMGVLEGWEFPKIQWERREGAGLGYITVTADQVPFNITAWKADSFTDYRFTVTTSVQQGPTMVSLVDLQRDFRILVARTPNTTDVKPQLTRYSNIGVGNPEDNVYQAVVELPKSGWSCFFVEMMFKMPMDHFVTFTTEISIVPDDKWASEDCTSDWECKGTLV